MNGFFQKRDPWGHGFALWVLAGLAFLAPLMVWSLRELRLDHNVQTWLPDHFPEARVYQWYRSHFPDEQRILVSWEGSTLKDPRIQRLAESLRGVAGPDGVRRGGSPFVAEVYTPQDGIQRMVEYGVDPQEALRQLEGILIGQGWMKVRLAPAGRVEAQRSIRDLVEHAQSRLGIELTVHERVTDWIDETYLKELDESGEAVGAGDALAPMIPEHDFQLSWDGLTPTSSIAEELRELLLNYRGFATATATSGRQLVEDCFFATGTPTGIVVTLSEAGGVEPEDAIRSIRWAAADCGIPEPALHVGGRAVTAAALNQSVQKTAWNPDPGPAPILRRSPLLLSATVALLMAMLLLGSVRLGLIVVALGWYATALAVGVIPLTGEPMSMLLVAMLPLVMILAIALGMLVVNDWRFAVLEHPPTAISRTAELSRRPVVQAGLMMAIGLAVVCVSPLAPVRQFGLHAALGCLVVLGVVLYGLPALLQVWPGRAPALRDIEGRGWKQYGLLVYRQRRLVGGLCLVLCAVAACGLRHTRLETKVVRFFPDTARLVQDYAFLESNLAGVTPVDIVVRFDQNMQERTKFLERMEIVRQVENELCQHPEISGAVSLADFQPITERPPTGARRQDVLKYLRKSQAVEQAIKQDQAEATASLLVMPKSPSDLARPGDAGLNGPGDELWRITAQAQILSDIDYGVLVKELNDRVQGVTRYHPGASHVVTGTVPLFLRTQQVVLRSLTVTFVLAFVVMTLVMARVLRDLPAGVVSLMPGLLSVLAVFGALAWKGTRIDIGSLITAFVALGVVVTGTLYQLTWFQRGLDRGRSRCRAMIESLGRCAPVMCQTCVVVAVGLLMFSRADLQLISRFGQLTAALISVVLVANLMLLPALLAGWLGARLESRTVAARATTKALPATTPHPAAHLTLPHPQAPTRQAG